MLGNVSFASLRRTPASMALIVLNLAVFAALTVEPSLEGVLGLAPGWEAVAELPWTPVTVMFTSGSLLHVLAAVAVLLVLGRALEASVGSRHLVAVYLLSGVTGSLAMTAAAAGTGHAATSLGASAAFLGVLAAMVTAPPTPGWERLPVKPALAAILLVNAAAPVLGIGPWGSTFGHLAGMAAGAAYAFSRRAHRGAGTRRPPQLQRTGGDRAVSSVL